MLKSYEQIKNAAQCETIIEKSKFICKIEFAADETAARRVIDETRKSHPFATHNCYAYIVNNGEISRFSDDGEPQGTAGQPMLAVFDRENVQNVVCIVTRYFGGILLGTGGLLRAYSSAAKQAIADAGTVNMIPLVLMTFSCGYSDHRKITLELQRFGAAVEKTEFGAEVELTVSVHTENADPLAARVTEMTAGRVVAVRSGMKYGAE